MTEFKGDKRTKEYKQWKKNHEAASNGLGDTVEKLTKATGIKKAVKFVAGEDCGCDQRKEKLNKLLPNRFEYIIPESGHLPHIENQEDFENYLFDVVLK